MKKWLFCWLLLVPGVLTAQSVPQGIFLQDSLKVGQLVSFAFSYRHSPNTAVFFPDSSYNFAPFDYVGREIYPTVTDDRGSRDSVVYLLRTFKVQPAFGLSLPIMVVTEADSTVVKSVPDSVWLHQLVDNHSLNRTTPKGDFTTVPVKQPFNAWKYLRVILMVLGVVGGIYLFFGKFLRRKYLIFRFRRKHRDFVSKFKKYMKESESSPAINQALILWKTHLQNLEKVPFTTLTTKEIVETIPDERLGEALRMMDMSIYGDVQSNQMIFAMNKLLDIANERFERQRKSYDRKLRERRGRERS